MKKERKIKIRFEKLSKRQQTRIKKLLSELNQTYVGVIKSTREKIRKSENDFLEELEELECLCGKISSGRKFHCRKNGEKIFDEDVACFFLEKSSIVWVIVEEISFALHVLNGTYFKVSRENINWHKLFISINNTEKMKNLCEKYLFYLPDEINIYNMEEPLMLAKKLKVPALHYNLNYSLIDALTLKRKNSQS